MKKENSNNSNTDKNTENLQNLQPKNLTDEVLNDLPPLDKSVDDAINELPPLQTIDFWAEAEKVDLSHWWEDCDFSDWGGGDFDWK